MARDLDARQRAELSEFVNAIAQAAGYSTTAEWARDSGYPASNLSNLRNGRSAVDGFNLLRLLRAAAARTDLTVSELAAGLARETATAADDDAVAARLEQLDAHVLDMLAILRGRRTGIEIAEDLVTRLDEGADVDPDQLAATVAQLQDTAELCSRLAARLRSAGVSAHSAP